MPRFENLVWYIFALFLILLGIQSIFGGRLFSAVLIFSGIFIVIGKFMQRGLQRRKEFQTIVVYAPIRSNTPEKILPLLLNCDDAWIISYLKRHGKTKEDDEGIKIRYKGPQIYFPTQNFFLFRNKACRPDAVKVVACGGFDILTAKF